MADEKANTIFRGRGFYSSPKLQDCIDKILIDKYPTSIVWERMAVAHCPAEFLITTSEMLTRFFERQTDVYRIAWKRGDA